MEFRIADTFTDSLARLPGDEQKAAKTTAFDLQMDPANTGMQFHRLSRGKDPNFWSVRVSRDLRLIVHKTGASLMLCYVGPHDDAYAWAERRKIERHPKTGAAQLVEVRETVREIQVPIVVRAAAQQVELPLDAAVAPAAPPPVSTPLFAEVPEEELLRFGVPPEWLVDVLEATDETLLDLAQHLPGEAAEALLDLATGGAPALPSIVVPAPIVVPPAVAAQPPDVSLGLGRGVGEEARAYAPAPPRDDWSDALEHPDARRRFRLVANVEELERALEYPWDKWTVFLHPAQRDLVERDFPGPARVAGSAGTGKTIVALHRAVHLARSRREARVLLATFSETLASALRRRLERLIGNEPRVMERIEVHSMSAIGRRLYKANFGQSPRFATPEQIRGWIASASASLEDQRFNPRFLFTEWTHVVDAWQLRSWEDYRDVQRLGRKTRLAEKQRKVLWSIFEQVRSSLEQQGLLTEPAMLQRLAEKLRESGRPPFDHAVIDEAQDIDVAELRFLAALDADRRNGLFVAGDLGQRIFRTPFSWLALGVDVRGRSTILRINYRTSHQIRAQADRLLAPELADVDGISEDRRRTQSVFNGPPPTVTVFDTEEEECAAVADWIQARRREGVEPHEIAVFVRSEAQLPRARAAVGQSRGPFQVLGADMGTKLGCMSIATMHQAKGLEFRAVAVIACDDEILPSQERIENVADDPDLDEVYNTERHLLYVACTRARDRLLVTGVVPGSEFLDDLQAQVRHPNPQLLWRP